MDEMPIPAGGLAGFIRSNLESILQRWEDFARSIPSGRQMNTAALRDHAGGMLLAMASDLEAAQAAGQSEGKSREQAPHAGAPTAAERHGAGRAAAGFSVNETVSEFRALRASVLHCWHDSHGGSVPFPNIDIIRFNEAIDQALSESLQRYSLDKEETTRRFDSLLSASPDLQYILDMRGTILYANLALEKLLTTPEGQLTGKNIAALCSSQSRRLMRGMQRVKLTGEPWLGEIICRHGNGPVTYRYGLIPVLNEEGAVESFSGSARNISELKASEEMIRRNAYYDSLTGLPNRTLFGDRLEQEVKHAARSCKTLALLFIDLDGFKEVNDRSGHAAGDALLRETALRIAACVRASDTVARLGGDEFTVILSDAGTLEHIENLAQQILDELARPYKIQEQEQYVTGSVGITLYPQDAQTPDDLLRNADQAMFMAKGAGRNRFSFFTAELRDRAWARLKVIGELRHALALCQLAVYYQPIVDMSTGAIAKAEALLRWQHPESGMILPGEFIGLAEESGLIGEIGAWVMDEAVTRAQRWSALTGTPFQVSVNKSPMEFMSRSVMNTWDCHLERLEQAGRQITVELTEGIMLNDSPGVRDKLDKLQRAGVQFAIDDFGIGYSSLAYLKKFKVDYLKIDQSFVKDMMSSADSRIFAETIIDMSHKLGLKVIAEGVESTGQRDLLKALGCDYAQGFLFSKATTAEKFEEMLVGQAGCRP